MTRLATTGQLLEMSAMVKEGLEPSVAQQLDPEGRHVVVKHFLHNDTEVRAVFWLKLNGKDQPLEVVMDCPIRMYNALLSVD